MNKYGPNTANIIEDAQWIIQIGKDAEDNVDIQKGMDEIADILYYWYVKGLVFGINLTEEN